MKIATLLLAAIMVFSGGCSKKDNTNEVVALDTNAQQSAASVPSETIALNKSLPDLDESKNEGFKPAEKAAPKQIEEEKPLTVSEYYSTTLIGSWQTSKPFSIDQDEGSVTFSDSKVIYYSDGTSSGSTKFKFNASQIPSDLSNFSFTYDGKWQVIDKLLKETTTSVHVVALTTNPAGREMAKIFENEFQNSPSSASEVIKINSNQLILKDITTGTIIEFKKL